ncbi:putative ABC transport system permease protein [Eubacterium ruminantium]|nr:putative ABC transport system permease protein [Eubacterium ruminantium]
MFENIRLSFQGIFGHKLRSFLTMLGIIIGIAAIIAIVSTIKGTNDQIKNNLVGSGDNLVAVNLSMGGYTINPGEGMNLENIPVINGNMLNEMKELKGVQDVSIYHSTDMYGSIFYKNKSADGIKLFGSDNNYLDINNYQITAGRKFVADDFDKIRNVCIIDRNAAQSFFEGENPVGKTIEIKGTPFVVAGVVDKNEDFEPVINSPEEWYTYYGDENGGFILVPDSAWPEIVSYDQPYQVIVKAKTTEAMSEAGKNVEEYLNGFINTGRSRENDENTIKYKRENTLEKVKQLQELSNTTSQQLIWIASISLLVGGIGVMNIMLVSVTERTREIGLKKALGARKRAVLGQFLTEAAVLTSLGGLLGVGAGIGLAYFISNLASVPVAISIPAIIISVAFSMLIGIIFGLIPSIKASNLNPIDALRYE